MCLSTFHSLYVLLIAMILVRILLSKSNFATLVTVSLTSFLSFAFFESSWTLFPLALYLLKDHILLLFTWLKTPFFKLENSFLFGNKEQEKETVLAIKRNEEALPRSSDNQIVSRGQSPSLSSDNLFAPLESLQEYRYVQWFSSGLCAFTLLTTSQIAWVIVRKLDYTQDLVNKMIAKGVPKSLLFWIRHPNPGPVGGRPLFNLMVGVLLGNLIVLYLLIKMIHLLP